MDRNRSVVDQNLPSTSTSNDGGVISVDISSNFLVDSVTEVPPDLIMNLDPLVHFKHLTSLIADDNPITENCVLPPLPRLQLLWVNYCKIASLYPWVEKLKESCPNLQYLCLMEDQKSEAQRLYRRPFFERIVKPNSGGISQLMQTSVSWSSVQNKISSLWGKDKQDNRNLLI
ncbi:hypothetical protein MSG28_008238 [Choristoneura fumiferana]|uniref:Uncharacterized protein n=1 Tax=Choristoneura fumiferana TaxID=7141 RepID=A0ACC0JAP6_CHOFU|nr:hypothetical protein MSG28_008238 [Choristoneura fumiferana]